MINPEKVYGGKSSETQFIWSYNVRLLHAGGLHVQNF